MFVTKKALSLILLTFFLFSLFSFSVFGADEQPFSLTLEYTNVPFPLKATFSCTNDFGSTWFPFTVTAPSDGLEGGYNSSRGTYYSSYTFSSPVSYVSRSVVTQCVVRTDYSANILSRFGDYTSSFTVLTFSLQDNVNYSGLALSLFNSSGQLVKTVSISKLGSESDYWTTGVIELSSDIDLSHFLIQASFSGSQLSSTAPSFRLRYDLLPITITFDRTIAEAYSQATYTIIENDLIPTVENIEQSAQTIIQGQQAIQQGISSVESSMNEGFSNLESSVNNGFSNIESSIDELPNNIVGALESQAEKDADNFESAAEENSGKALEEIEKVLPLKSFSDSLKLLSNSFGYEGRTESIVFPGASLPSFAGGSVLWEEQTIPISESINKFPTVFIIIVRAVFEVALMFGALFYLYLIIKSSFGGSDTDE